MKTRIALLTLGTILSLATPTFAETLPSTLPIVSKNTIGTNALTSSDDILPGESSEKTYTYTVLKNETPSDNKFLSLDWTHSELLISPSALTIEIDGQPVKSIALSKDTATGNSKVMLTANQLTKGTHEITVQYTGILQGRMCDHGNTSGSWLTIRPSSFVALSEGTSSLSLQDFPNPFIQTFNDSLTVVLPEEANNKELEAGLLLYREFKQEAVDADNVSLRYANTVNELSGRYVFVGEIDSFANEIGKWTKKLSTDIKDGDVLLQRATLKNSSNQTDALFVLTNDAEAFEGKLDYVLDNQQRAQLNGDRLILNTNSSKRPTQNIVTMQTLGAGNLYLTGSAATSSHYFYPLPVSKNKSTVDFVLKYKVSNNLLHSQDEQVKPEFTAWVNNIPYSIPIDEAKEGEWLNHSIQVDTASLNRASFLDVSFEVKGLLNEAPCNGADSDRWIFLSNDSEIILPSNDGTPQTDAFQNVASLFESDKGVVIVIDQQDETVLSNLGTVLNELPISPRTEQLTILSIDEATEEAISDRSVLYIGNPESYPLLNEQRAKWTISDEGNVDLTKFGFVPETVEQVAWIQPSFWNDDYALVVISTKDQPIEQSLIQSIGFPTETFSVAVQSKNGSVFTNSAYLDSDIASVVSNETSSESRSSIWYFAGFITLLLAVFGILIFMRRKKITG